MNVAVRSLKVLTIDQVCLLFVGTEAFVRVFQLSVDDESDASERAMSTACVGKDHELVCFEALRHATPGETGRAVRGFGFDTVNDEHLLSVFGHRALAVFRVSVRRDDNNIDDRLEVDDVVCRRVPLRSRRPTHDDDAATHAVTTLSIVRRLRGAHVGPHWLYAAQVRSLNALLASTTLEPLRSVVGARRRADEQCVVLACSANDNALLLFDLADGTLLGRVRCTHRCMPMSAALAPASSQSSTTVVVASGTAFGDVLVWCGASGAVLRVLRGHAGAVRHCAWRCDAAALVSSSDDRSARVWRCVSSQQCATTSTSTTTTTSTGGDVVLFGHEGRVYSSAFVGLDHVATASEDGTVRCWRLDATSTSSRALMRGGGSVWTIDCDATTLCAGAADGTARVWRQVSAAK